jgi:hypothetical protein
MFEMSDLTHVAIPYCAHTFSQRGNVPGEDFGPWGQNSWLMDDLVVTIAYH